jgi:hypothetical protein
MKSIKILVQPKLPCRACIAKISFMILQYAIDFLKHKKGVISAQVRVLCTLKLRSGFRAIHVCEFLVLHRNSFLPSENILTCQLPRLFSK